MSTLTISRDRLADELKPGDHIVAIDDRPVDHRVAGITRILINHGGIRLHSPHPTEISWNLYPDTHVEREVTIEREDDERSEPAPVAKSPKPKQRREIRRTRYGLTLVSGRPRSQWETEDGEYSLHQGWAETYCDAPHPKRWKDANGFWQSGYCPGDQMHDYIVGWVIDGPSIPGVYELSEPHETFDQAWAFLAEALRSRS